MSTAIDIDIDSDDDVNIVDNDEIDVSFVSLILKCTAQMSLGGNVSKYRNVYAYKHTSYVISMLKPSLFSSN